MGVVVANLLDDSPHFGFERQPRSNYSPLLIMNYDWCSRFDFGFTNGEWTTRWQNHRRRRWEVVVDPRICAGDHVAHGRQRRVGAQYWQQALDFGTN